MRSRRWDVCPRILVLAALWCGPNAVPNGMAGTKSSEGTNASSSKLRGEIAVQRTSSVKSKPARRHARPRRAKPSPKPKSKHHHPVVEKETPFRINPARPPMPPPPSEPMRLTAIPAFADFDLPTQNQMLFSRRNSSDFFQPTFSGRTISAMFGCVRNPGSGGRYTRFHEGVDIRPLERDSDGEPEDGVLAAGDGTVAYVCRDEEKSNYGRYVVIRHDLFGPPIYSLYAHMASIEGELAEGQGVSRGRKIGVLGRSSNEFEIDPGHAHLHFEINLMVNDRYERWCDKTGRGMPMHGLYNGANLIGVDPVRFYQFLQLNPDLGIGDFVTREKTAFRVLVPMKKKFSWVRLYPFCLTRPVPSGTRAWEISMTYYGLPTRVTPRTREEILPAAWKSLAAGWPVLTYANTPDLIANAACHLLVLKGKRWSLTSRGREWIGQLTY